MGLTERLEQEGFIHHVEDEPYEDYWILEYIGTGIDILVEKTEDGWEISRSPAEDEPRGEWVGVSSGLDEGACLAEIERLLQGDRAVS